MQTWEEQLGDELFVFRGDRDSSDQSKRVVVEIRSIRSLAKRQAVAGIPPAYRGALLSGWDDSKSNPETKLIVEHYLANPTHSLFLHGAVGVGKTWAVCAIANELLKKGKALRFQPVNELLLELRDSFTQEGLSEKAVLSPYFETGFLILDELGELAASRDRTASVFAASRILTLLDIRSRRGRPTITTSNLSLEKLERWSDDPRISSRIAGMCGLEGIFEITGRDLRLQEAVPCR